MIRMVCYDIEENKTRTKLSDLLELHGFDRIQYSVFVGKIPIGRWQKLWSEIEKLYTEKGKSNDRIYSHVIEHDHFKKMTILGNAIDTAWVLQEIKVWFV